MTKLFCDRCGTEVPKLTFFPLTKQHICDGCIQILVGVAADKNAVRIRDAAPELLARATAVVQEAQSNPDVAKGLLNLQGLAELVTTLTPAAEAGEAVG